MANRRMLSKTITDSSAFLMMPLSSQALYMHLNQHADDDGYCEYFGIMRLCGAQPDDLAVLKAKHFVQIFDDKVLILRDWKENNLIKNDRYSPSKYKDMYKLEPVNTYSGSKVEPKRIQRGSKVEPQYRIGKVRLGKVSNTTAPTSGTDDVGSEQVQTIIFKFQHVNPSYQQLFARKNQREAVKRMISIHGYEALVKLVDNLAMIVEDRYAPRVTTPMQLEEKLGQLVIYLRQKGQDGESRVATI